MDPTYKFPGSPGTPLYQVSPERVNQQRGRNGQELPSSPIVGALKSSSYRENHSRESSVHEKVAAFNSLAVSQTDKKIMEQGAQLKRAMVGREEAVRARGDAEQQRDQARSELRKYEAETKKLNKQVELLLKKLDEGKGRELIVCQKLETRQEELGQAKEKYAHTKAEWEKEVRRLRKESFKSQSMMVKIQEELKAARMDLRIQSLDFEAEKERSRVREQEAFEARYQLVGVQEELAQMMEKVKLVEQERDALRTIAKNEEIARIAAEGQLPLPRLPENDEFASPKKARRSLDPVTVLSSAASEEELEDIKLLLQWERHNAARAHDRVEFLEMECRMNCQTSRASRATSPEQVVTGRATPVEEDTVIYSPQKPEEQEEEAKQSHIFIPAEGIFRAVPSPTEESPWISPAKKTVLQPSPAFTELDEVEEPPRHARTPSCEPPAPAVIQDASITALINSSRNASSRASLQSLLDAPHSPSQPSRPSYNSSDDNDNTASFDSEDTTTTINLTENIATTLVPTFHTISTTTRIPLKMEVAEKKPSIAPITVLKPGDRTFDPAILSPTMTREEALAQIQARRGRARSIAQGTLTPRKQMVEGGVRRDISAPAFRSGGTVRGRSQARAAAL